MDMSPELDPSIRNDISMIRRNVELEAKLIDDLLDLSRVATGKLRLDLETMALNDCIEHVCQACKPFVLEKGITLHIDLPPDSPHVKADPARIQQVLWNLIKNATKFTPDHGDIFVTAQLLPNQRVRMLVRDTGIGIAPEATTVIFEAFEQGDPVVARQFGGMGLGLAISKALVEMHGGTISVYSGGPNTGATFTIELPVVEKDHTVSAGSHSVDGDCPLRILLVEDHADTAYVLGRLLRLSGHDVTTAGTVAEAVSLADRETFDVLISDIGLPDATGYDLMRQLKSRTKIKGIAMSGYGMDEDVRKSREAGFSEHVVKPADAAQLERVIRRVACGLD
jgi:CheY-like chemotaxis protein